MINQSETHTDEGDLPAYTPVHGLSTAERRLKARATIPEATRLAREAETDRDSLLDDLASAVAYDLMGEGQGVSDSLITELEEAIVEAERRVRRYEAARLAVRSLAGY
jgi:hypothetical protein